MSFNWSGLTFGNEGFYLPKALETLPKRQCPIQELYGEGEDSEELKHVESKDEVDQHQVTATSRSASSLPVTWWVSQVDLIIDFTPSIFPKDAEKTGELFQTAANSHLFGVSCALS